MFRVLAFKLGLPAITAIPLLATILAGVTGGDETNYTNYLLNGGPFAIVVFLVVTDRLTPPGERNRLRVELTAAHEREEKLNENLRTEIVPALTKNIDALTANEAAATKLAELNERQERLLAEAERVWHERSRGNDPSSGR